MQRYSAKVRIIVVKLNERRIQGFDDYLDHTDVTGFYHRACFERIIDPRLNNFMTDWK